MDRFEILREGRWLDGFHGDYGKRLREAEESCFRFNSLPPSAMEERREIVEGLLGSLGKGWVIHSPFRCDFGFNIHVGKGFVGNFNLTILDEARVTIGDHVFIGPDCGIYTIIHALDEGQRNEGVMRALPVTIGNGVWIGGHCTILPGVTIGDGAVIGAGSTVTRDIPPRTLAVGSPCRPLRPITDADRIEEILR